MVRLILLSVILLLYSTITRAETMTHDKLVSICEDGYSAKMAGVSEGSSSYQRLRDQFLTEKLICECIAVKADITKADEGKNGKVILSQSYTENFSSCRDEVYKVGLIHACFNNELPLNFNVDLNNYTKHENYKSCMCVSEKLEKYDSKAINEESRIAYQKYQMRIANLENKRDINHGVDDIQSPLQSDIKACEDKFGVTPLTKN